MDSISNVWKEIQSKFPSSNFFSCFHTVCTFVVANAIPDQRMAQIFLTNQIATIYKQLANLAAQQNPPKDINVLTMEEIVNFMKKTI